MTIPPQPEDSSNETITRRDVLRGRNAEVIVVPKAPPPEPAESDNPLSGLSELDKWLKIVESAGPFINGFLDRFSAIAKDIKGVEQRVGSYRQPAHQPTEYDNQAPTVVDAAPPRIDSTENGNKMANNNHQKAEEIVGDFIKLAESAVARNPETSVKELLDAITENKGIIVSMVASKL